MIIWRKSECRSLAHVIYWIWFIFNRYRTKYDTENITYQFRSTHIFVFHIPDCLRTEFVYDFAPIQKHTLIQFAKCIITLLTHCPPCNRMYTSWQQVWLTIKFQFGILFANVIVHYPDIDIHQDTYSFLFHECRFKLETYITYLMLSMCAAFISHIFHIWRQRELDVVNNFEIENTEMSNINILSSSY